jgi:hypothetical protein
MTLPDANDKVPAARIKCYPPRAARAGNVIHNPKFLLQKIGITGASRRVGFV